MAATSFRRLGTIIHAIAPPARRLMAVAAVLALTAPVHRVQAADPSLNPRRQDPEVVPAVASAYAAKASAASQQTIYRPITDAALKLCVPRLTPGFEFRAGLLFLQPSAENLGYAVLTNEENLASPVPLAQPFWGVQTLNPSLQPGFEFGARYAFANSGNDFQVNWQHLRTTTSDSVAATQASGQWVSPFSQTGPSTAESYNDLLRNQGVNKLRAATGQVRFAYDAVNVDFGQYVNVGSSLELRLLGGLSYARLQERLVSSFFGVPPGPNAPFPQSVPLFLSLDNTSTFSGVGPRIGLDAAYKLPRGFRVTGELASALLIGRTQPAQYLFTATSPELAAVGIAVNREHISSDAFTQVVYALNAKLGLSYSRAFSNRSTFALEAGYLAAIYINPFSGYETNNNVLPLQIGSLSTASMRHTQSNFTLNGIYANASFKW